MADRLAFRKEWRKSFLDNSCTCVIKHISIMKSIESPENVRRWFLRQVSELWPLAAGSLSLRTGPCIREHCSACQRGEGHASYALYGRKKNRRFSVYVPEELVPLVQQAVNNGRKLEQLLREAGLRYTVALKAKRAAAGASVRKSKAR
jgi:hypothetical protein